MKKLSALSNNQRQDNISYEGDLKKVLRIRQALAAIEKKLATIATQETLLLEQQQGYESELEQLQEQIADHEAAMSDHEPIQVMRAHYHYSDED